MDQNIHGLLNLTLQRSEIQHDWRRGVLGWDKLRVNLPGDSTYDPRMAWVFKLRVTEKGVTMVANDFVTYVDDKRVIASSPVLVRQTSHVATSRAQRLGKQDTSRKRRHVH